MSDNAFMNRIKKGECVLVAEGYLFEFERRGYLKAGAFVPEVVLEHPELVRSLSEEFVHSGSDVVLAFQYYGHREKLRLIGREDDLERMNRKALEIAKDVAKRTGTLFAGNICNTTMYERDNPAKQKEAEAMLKEQIEWSVDAGVDFILGETYMEFAEAMLAVECMKKYGKGIPCVINIAPSGLSTTVDGVPFAEACRRLEEAGADVVGLNCARGPATILPVMREVRAACKGPIACIPVPYRTTKEEPVFQALTDKFTGNRAFPVDLPSLACGRAEVRAFAESCKEIGIEVVGICCGNASHYMREVAEVYGRNPPACRYSPDISQHFMFGDKTKFRQYSTQGIRTAFAINES